MSPGSPTLDQNRVRGTGKQFGDEEVAVGAGTLDASFGHIRFRTNEDRERRSRQVSYFGLVGCALPALGCTIVLRGGAKHNLRELKRLVRHVVSTAYDLRLRSAFMQDSGIGLLRELSVGVNADGDTFDELYLVALPTLAFRCLHRSEIVKPVGYVSTTLVNSEDCQPEIGNGNLLMTKDFLGSRRNKPSRRF